MDPERPGRLSYACIRRVTGLLLVMYRLQHLASVAVEVPETFSDMDIHTCHVQAAMDNFHLHSMHADLPPAARLMYEQVRLHPVSVLLAYKSFWGRGFSLWLGEHGPLATPLDPPWACLRHREGVTKEDWGFPALAERDCK